MLKKSNKKFECSSLCIVIFSIIIICILYTVLNFRGHIVIKNKKVIGYKWGIVEKVKRDEKYVLYTVGDIPFFWSSGYRMNFFIVDLNTGNKIRPVKWEIGDRFYGIDW